MDILYLLIPVGLVLLGVAIWGFLWAVRSGQFDDLEGPAHRILMDDDDPLIPRNQQPEEEKKDQNEQEEQ
ncbi:MAG: cbb3-type cytochrome oxidase assembly protein CcoS [Gammaproteobacteria bacterium]